MTASTPNTGAPMTALQIQAVVNGDPFETYDPVTAIIIRTAYHDYEQPLTPGTTLSIAISHVLPREPKDPSHER